MDFIKKVYRADDLEELPLAEIPSLDLPYFIVDKAFMPADGGKYIVFYAHIDKTYRPEEECPICSSHNWMPQGKAAKPRLVHDVTRSNYRVDIVFFPPRMSCKDCGYKITPAISGIAGSKQMTTRLEEFLRVECFLQPFTQLAERTGFSIQTISAIMDEEIVKYDKMREENPIEAPTVLGIDEKHICLCEYDSCFIALPPSMYLVQLNNYCYANLLKYYIEKRTIPTTLFY